MSVREIPPAEWPAFLDRFSRRHRAWLASVERVGPGSARRYAIVDRPLGAVTAEVTPRRIIGIEIQFQQDSSTSTAVRVDAPMRLRVEETEEGATRALEIEDENGECTRVQFRVATPPGMLDGIAPGEL